MAPVIAQALRPRPRRPLRKSLEQTVRGLKNSDEFVAHIAAISARYRVVYAQDSKDARAAMKQSVRTFRKHAAALTEWFANATRAQAGEALALGQLEEQMRSAPGFVAGQSRAVSDWLRRAERTAAEILDGGARSGPVRKAPLLTSEALLATFHHHQLKTSLGSARTPGPIVQLLCALAKAAGDELSTEEARSALAQAKGRR